jgi:type VI protein secretion system component VasK
MIRFNLLNSAFRGYSRTFRADTDYSDIEILHREARTHIYNLLNESLILRLRLLICASVIFIKETENDIVRRSFYFCSETERVLSRHQLYDSIDRAFQKIKANIYNFVRFGSG